MARRSQRFAIGLSVAIALACSKVAAAQVIEESLRTDIEQLMDVTGTRNLALQMMNTARQQGLDAIKAGQPNIPPRALEVVQQVLDEHLTKALTGPDSILAGLVAVYAKHFTQGEIRGLLAFYRTDLGKKTIAVMPALFQESAAVGDAWNARHIPELTAELERRLRAEAF